MKSFQHFKMSILVLVFSFVLTASALAAGSQLEWATHYDKKPKKPQRDSKTVPCNIEQHLFCETRITG